MAKTKIKEKKKVHRPSKPWNAILLTIGLILITGMALWVPRYLISLRDEATQTFGNVPNKPAGMIADKEMFIQEFTLQKNFLTGIDIFMATWSRDNTNLNYLYLMDARYTILAEIAFRSEDVTDNAFYSFRFPRGIKQPKGQKLIIGLWSDNGTTENGITAWTDTTQITSGLYKTTFAGKAVAGSVAKKRIPMKGGLIFKTIEAGMTEYLRYSAFLLIVPLLLIVLLIIMARQSKKSGAVSKADVFQTIIFLLAVSVPGIYFILLQPKKPAVSSREQRLLAARPKLEISTLKDFPLKFENFFNDYFPSREPITELRSRMVYDLVGRSPFPADILVGKDGWLFKPKERPIIDGEYKIFAKDVDSLVLKMSDRALYYKSRGIQFYIVLVPLKSDIYREYLPGYYRHPVEKSVPDAFAEGLKGDTSLNIIDLKPVFQEAKKSKQVFFKTDFHWSEAGAWIAYSEILTRISRDFPQVRPLSETEVDIRPIGNKSGNSAIEMGLAGYVTEPVYTIEIKFPKSFEIAKTGYPPTAGFGLPQEFEKVRITGDTSLPRIVVIRDSFFHLLLPLFAENFSRTVYIWDGWKYGANEAIIENEKPDIVLMEIYEGFMLNLLGTSD